jgi:hypothetical protein
MFFLLRLPVDVEGIAEGWALAFLQVNQVNSFTNYSSAP